MIKVNLLHDISSGVVGSISSSAGEGVPNDTQLLQDGPSVGFGELPKLNVAIKMLLIVVPFLLTYSYRTYLVNRAEAKKVALTNEKTAADTKLKSFDASLRDIEKFEEEKRRLNSQLAVIKSLSKERLKNVKSLDALQGLIPSSAWLDSLKITDDKVELEGFAVNDVVVSEFMTLLGSSIYFSHVVLSESTEAVTPEGGVKKFRIKCNLESI